MRADAAGGARRAQATLAVAGLVDGRQRVHARLKHGRRLARLAALARVRRQPPARLQHVERRRDARVLQHLLLVLPGARRRPVLRRSVPFKRVCGAALACI